MSDFSDRPLVAGSVMGLRAFKIDTLGRVTGVTVQTVWTPGENLAECKWDKVNSGGLFMGSVASLMGSITAPYYSFDPVTGATTVTMGKPNTPSAPDEPAKAKARHEAEDLVSLKCQCGFYAYFDGGNDYEQDRYLSGIVEGYGRVVVGTRGFRAEKSRIVALIQPKHLRKKARGDFKTDALWDKVARNYSGIPTYNSVPLAIAEHPLTPPPEPSPETDDNFWTMSAS